MRSFDWQKKRFYARQEFVIGGYKPGGTDSVLSIVVGVYEDGKLVFSSKVNGGLNQQNRRELRRELRRLNSSRSPFVDLPNSESRRAPSGWSSGGITAEEMKEIQWVRPELVAEVKFVEWTRGNKLREPLFVGLRMDKWAKEVVREIPRGT